jgi:hypothetical protein
VLIAMAGSRNLVRLADVAGDEQHQHANDFRYLVP